MEILDQSKELALVHGENEWKLGVTTKRMCARGVSFTRPWTWTVLRLVGHVGGSMFLFSHHHPQLAVEETKEHERQKEKTSH